MQPQQRSQLDHIAAHLGHTFRQSVSPILGRRVGGDRPWGTGTFFRVGEAFFLVTAAHVWTTAEQLGYDLAVFDVERRPGEQERLRTVPLSGHIHYLSETGADVAVVELDEAVVGELSGRRFLRLNEVALAPQPPGLVWVYGFPAETVQEEPGSVYRYNEFSFCTGLSSNDGSLVRDYDRRLHFLLVADRNDISARDETPGQMPHDLGGISGCSVWQVMRAGQPGFDPGRVRIVGVQHGYVRKQSLITATCWGVVAQILWHQRPDLRDILRMHLGEM